MMIIKIAGLSEGVHNFILEESVEKLDLGEPFFGNVEAAVELNKTYNQVILSVNLKVNASFECDRCIRVFNQQLTPFYRVVYILGEHSSGEDEDSNVIYLPAEADKINIRTEVRDYILLEVPMKKLCKEDCKGLCPKCGRNLNEESHDCENQEIDSRWTPLQQLKKKL